MGPQTLLVKIVLSIRRSGPRLIQWARRVGWWKVGAGVLVVVLLIGGAYILWGKPTPQDVPIVTVPSVEIKSVAELSNQTSPLSVVGQVSSKSEATVRAEKAGQAIAVYKALGDAISAGAVAAEIENASERAAVLQAEAGVEAAQANLSKTTGGVRSEQRSILEANLTSASASLDAAQTGAVSTLLSSYAAADNAIRGTADKMFTEPESDSPLFHITSNDVQLTENIENTRRMLRAPLKREAEVSLKLSPSSDLASEIAISEEEIRTMRSFLDMIISALNKGVTTSFVSQATIDTNLAQAIAARTALTGSLSSLSGATQSLASAASTVEVAKKNLEQGVAGGQPEDVAAAQAAVKQAQGGLAAARANVEKTIIRAPISGTINSFSLKRGDYVQMSSPVLTVANNGALEIVAYITENDAREIAVGQKASIDTASGVVTRIAPALDPITKKIEVRIGVDNAKDLINGQSVLVSIVRATAPASSAESRITIPISAIKVESDRVIVFSVASDNTLVAHPVVLGALLGDRVVVSSGVSGEMKIVTDARGLREGEKVEVSAQGGSSSGGK